ncbi:MAG: DUF4375 domain-containing protein [Planctomycetes bacterium]|nr:DUF4375 domain-containing protein [Planctomycetota bacterium]
MERIGAPATKDILAKANGRFPGGAPPADISEREALMEAYGEDVSGLWSDLDDEFYEYPDPVEERLWSYYKGNRSGFR